MLLLALNLDQLLELARVISTIGARFGLTAAAAIGNTLAAPVGGVGGTLPVAVVIGSLLGSFGGGMLAVLAGGITSAYNSNLFGNSMFYFNVHKKLKELQKKGQNQSA